MGVNPLPVSLAPVLIASVQAVDSGRRRPLAGPPCLHAQVGRDPPRLLHRMASSGLSALQAQGALFIARHHRACHFFGPAAQRSTSICTEPGPWPANAG